MAISCYAIGQKITPSSKVTAAYSSTEIAGFSESVIAELNLRGDKLCMFEDVKEGVQFNEFQLYSRAGKLVQLNSADLATFNPLLYRLPQSENSCENLLITTSEGTKKLLIVRSVKMMKAEAERMNKPKKKTKR